jgi:hypothetical protein
MDKKSLLINNVVFDEEGNVDREATRAVIEHPRTDPVVQLFLLKVLGMVALRIAYNIYCGKPWNDGISFRDIIEMMKR